jgi:hypothetical protein
MIKSSTNQNNITFSTTDSVKTAFNIQGIVEFGDPSQVSVIKHPVIVRENEDSPVSVQIGSLIGDTIYIDTALASKVNEIRAKLEKFLESGDHDGMAALDLIIIEKEGYRLYGDPLESIDDEGNEIDAFEINNTSLSKLLDSI